MKAIYHRDGGVGGIAHVVGIDWSVDEVAKEDGASALMTLVRVILPVARPGIIAVFVYALITAWGEVLFASVLTTQDTRTLPVGLGEYSTQINVYWNQIR